MRRMRTPLSYFLVAAGALLGAVAAYGLVIAPATSNGIAALIALAIAVLAAAAGFVQLLPRASTTLTGEARVAAAVLFAVGSVVALTLAADGGPVALGMALLPAPLFLRPARRDCPTEPET